MAISKSLSAAFEIICDEKSVIYEFFNNGEIILDESELKIILLGNTKINYVDDVAEIQIDNHISEPIPVEYEQFNVDDLFKKN